MARPAARSPRRSTFSRPAMTDARGPFRHCSFSTSARRQPRARNAGGSTRKPSPPRSRPTNRGQLARVKCLCASPRGASLSFPGYQIGRADDRSQAANSCEESTRQPTRKWGGPPLLHFYLGKRGPLEPSDTRRGCCASISGCSCCRPIGAHAQTFPTMRRG